MPHATRKRAGHPEEQQLLLLLDGELNSREGKSLASHLQWCRECRAKRQTLLEGLDALAEYSQSVLAPAAGRPPKGWNEFPALLDRIATAVDKPNRTKAS